MDKANDYSFLKRIHSVKDINYELNKYKAIDSIIMSKHQIDGQAIVITPTTGNQTLHDAIVSVKNQSYKNVLHLIVVDGENFYEDTIKIVSDYNSDKIKLLILPFNTGKHGFNGHRIYAGISYLINSEYVFFLDEDNWFENIHISSLVGLIEDYNLDWGFSLRQVFTQKKVKVVDDNCESIGVYPSYSGLAPLVDTNCYGLKNKILTKIASSWYHPLGADRYFFSKLRDVFPNFKSTALFTANYRLGTKKFPDENFFVQGNEFMMRKYNNKLPWLKDLNVVSPHGLISEDGN